MDSFGPKIDVMLLRPNGDALSFIGRLRTWGRRVIAKVILTPSHYGLIEAPVQHPTQEAIVIDAGDERTDLAPGDRILYRPYNIRGFTFEGEGFLVLGDDELLAKLETT